MPAPMERAGERGVKDGVCWGLKVDQRSMLTLSTCLCKLCVISFMRRAKCVGS